MKAFASVLMLGQIAEEFYEIGCSLEVYVMAPSRHSVDCFGNLTTSVASSHFHSCSDSTWHAGSSLQHQHINQLFRSS